MSDNLETLSEILPSLLAKRDLSDEQVEALVEEIVQGRCDEGLAAASLMGLRMKGESAAEIAAAARVLRRHMVRWHPGPHDVLDTCGTGGDHAGTFNISTATALVVAAAGVPVVKHGNRSVSSRSGSADVLSALGIAPGGDPASARRCLDQAGLAFCFAPLFHPALKNVAALRKRLGIPTLFNCLGPLANPAGAARQLLGVGRLDLLDRMAGALSRLGTERSLVVHGQDGLDEVSLAGPTLVRIVIGSEVQAQQWTPADFSLPGCTPGDWHAAGPSESARIIEDMVNGQSGPCSWVVEANAAAALWLAQRVPDLQSGVRLAREKLTTGKARQILDKLRALCKDE